MGQCILCPSPGSLWDRRGMGHQEVEEIYTGFLEDTGAKRTKKQDWIWPTDVHSICVTVRFASPLLSFGPWFSRQPDRSGGVETVLRHIASGACRGQTVPNPNPRNLKGSHDDYPNGGGGCLGHLPTVSNYACFMHAMHKAKRATPRRRQRPTRPTKKEPKEKPQNQKEGRRGWVRIRDINNP